MEKIKNLIAKTKEYASSNLPLFTFFTVISSVVITLVVSYLFGKKDSNIKRR